MRLALLFSIALLGLAVSLEKKTQILGLKTSLNTARDTNQPTESHELQKLNLLSPG